MRTAGARPLQRAARTRPTRRHGRANSARSRGSGACAQEEDVTGEPRPQDVVAGALLCAGVALAVIATTTATVRVAGLADDARHALGLRFTGVPHKPGIALSIGL